MLSLKYISALFFLSFFLVSTFGEQASSFSFGDQTVVEAHGVLDAGATFTFPMGFVEPNFPGGVDLVMTADNPIEVCLQKGFYNQGNLQSCNQGGYHLFNFSNTQQPAFSKSQAESNPDMQFFDNWWTVDTTFSTDSALLVLSGGDQYFGSVRFQSSNLKPGNDTTFKLSIMWSNTSCPAGKVGTIEADDCAPAPVVNSSIVQTLGATTSTFFSFDVPATANYPSQLNFTIPVKGADATQAGPWTVNAYINLGTAPDPTRKAYILSQTATLNDGQSLTLILPSPAPGVWFILIENAATSSFDYTVFAAAPTCAEGRVGQNCSSTPTDATAVSVTKATGQANGGYDYYLVKSTSSLIFGVSTLDVSGAAPIVLASLANYPSNQSFQVVSMNQDTNFLTLSTPSSVNWYVAVWSNPNQVYYYWTNSPCPNNCQGDTFDGTADTSSMHGTCSNTTGVCSCDKNYEHLYCEKKGLSAGWIVLIVIAAAIILAVGIGVPVGFYLRTKSKARYERV